MCLQSPKLRGQYPYQTPQNIGLGEKKVLFERYSLYANIGEKVLGIAIVALKNGFKNLITPVASETSTHINSITRFVDASSHPPKVLVLDKIKTKGCDVGERPGKVNERFKSREIIIISKLPK